MDLARYFRHPTSEGQLHYEILRASFFERLSPAAIAQRFKVTTNNVYVLRHRFKTGKLSFSWPRSMAQIPINVGDPGYDPLFPYGFGLTY